MPEEQGAANRHPDPLVTVIVPAHNEGRFIRPCLRSIRDQWFPALECVVIDDGSSDETLEIAEEFAKKDGRFRVVSHHEPRGPSAARNTGLAHSSAPFVTFLDGDDFLYKGSIKSRLDVLADTDPALVAGSYCDWQPTAHNQGRDPLERPAADKKKVVGFVDGPECPFIVTAPLVRRSVLERVGGFDEEMLTAEDFDLWVRVLRAGYTFVYVPMIGVAYRQKANGLVFSESASHAEASMAVLDRQYEDLSADDVPPVLPLPLPHYQLECARTRRLLRTYALAAASDDLDGVERIGRLIPADLDVLRRAGLNVDGALRAGALRAFRGIPELKGQAARDAFVAQLAQQLNDRPG